MAGVIQRFEQRLETVVTGAFARAFRSAVQPVEIAAALQREVDNSSQVLSRDRLLAPNVFVVELSSQDWARLAPFRDTLADELGRLVDEHVEEQRYTLTGPISIDFVEADDLGTGRFRVASSTGASVVSAAGPPAAAAVARDRSDAETSVEPLAPARTSEPAMTPAASVVIEVNGVRHPVAPPGLIIGRGSDAGLRINDPGISRKHAQLSVKHTGGTQVTISDLGSTNGIILNGRRVTDATIPDGSQLQLGNTHLVIHITTDDRDLTDA